MLAEEYSLQGAIEPSFSCEAFQGHVIIGSPDVDTTYQRDNSDQQWNVPEDGPQPLLACLTQLVVPNPQPGELLEVADDGIGSSVADAIIA